MSSKIELKNLGIYEFCLLDTATGEMKFYKDSKIQGFTGLYFKDNNHFFGLYPTVNGPISFYRGKEYPINKGLTIVLQKNGKKRRFIIEDYKIVIDYTESPYIGLDSWSDEIDVDLFYMIEQKYKDPSFYNQFTLQAD